jgi:hypothetical protein
MSKRPVSPRSRRREQERAAAKLARDRERLAALEPGGAPERAIDVESASQVEPHAFGLPCARCDAACRLDEHVAVEHGGVRLRVARLRCARCDARRDVWFRIAPRLPS